MLVVCSAVAGCGSGIRTSTILGHTVVVDTRRGNLGTTMQIDECPVGLTYDTTFERWGAHGETYGALYETPERVAEQLITAGFADRCSRDAASAAASQAP